MLDANKTLTIICPRTRVCDFAAAIEVIDRILNAGAALKYALGGGRVHTFI